MKKHLIILVTAALLTASGIALAGTNPSGSTTPKAAGPESNYKGKMQLSTEEFDFGYTPQRSKISHIFWLKNIGQDSLEIINIKPG